MGTKRRVAVWFRRGKEFVVKAPGWENRVELVFSEQEQMIDWALAAGLVLKDGNKRREYA